MDDNARPHRADIVDDYLKSEGIARMTWPAYSPDLLPIENLWDALGRAVSLRFPPPATLIELETALQEEWRLLNSAVVDHLIESMVRSIKNNDREKDIFTKNSLIKFETEMNGLPFDGNVMMINCTVKGETEAFLWSDPDAHTTRSQFILYHVINSPLPAARAYGKTCIK
ncbi:transposable element Tcb1 transposase [Trichonephila clavipes]|nr:transposable element Tcb1 transposase [Trichonephila clavipes]